MSESPPVSRRRPVVGLLGVTLLVLVAGLVGREATASGRAFARISSIAAVTLATSVGLVRLAQARGWLLPRWGRALLTLLCGVLAGVLWAALFPGLGARAASIRVGVVVGCMLLFYDAGAPRHAPAV